jgi:hypothetical protein
LFESSGRWHAPTCHYGTGVQALNISTDDCSISTHKSPETPSSVRSSGRLRDFGCTWAAASGLGVSAVKSNSRSSKIVARFRHRLARATRCYTAVDRPAGTKNNPPTRLSLVDAPAAAHLNVPWAHRARRQGATWIFLFCCGANAVPLLALLPMSRALIRCVVSPRVPRPPPVASCRWSPTTGQWQARKTLPGSHVPPGDSVSLAWQRDPFGRSPSLGLLDMPAVAV